MMGLLDTLLSGKWTNDPGKNQAINQGLLQAGLSLMTAKGGFSNALGQAGLLGLNAGQQSLEDQFRSKLRQHELEKMARQRAMEQLPEQFYRSPTQTALAQGGGPTVENAKALETAKPSIDMEGYLGALSRYDPIRARQIQGELLKGEAPIPVTPGTVLLDPRTRQPIFSNPKAGDQTQIGQLLAEMNSLPPDDPRRRIYMQAIDKASSHAPAVNVSYGQPVAGVDAKGNPVFFQPDKAGGPPAIVPNVKPAPQNRDTKLPAELQRMQIAGDAMVSLLDDYEALLRKHNPRDPATQLNPTARADIQAVKRNLELQFKELQALGALAGPDIDIMRQALSDPFSAAGAYYGREGLLAQTKRARELVKKRSEAVLKSQGQQSNVVDWGNLK